MTVKIYGPEKWMGIRRSGVWKGNKIHCYVAYNSFFIKDVAYRFTDGHHVHVWQRLLREEAAGIDVASCCETVH